MAYENRPLNPLGRKLSPPLTPAARKAVPPPPPRRPVTASNTTPIAPPLLPSQIVPPYEELTVDNLVKMFSLENLKKAVTCLRNEIGGEYYARPTTQLDTPGGLVVHNGKRKVVLVGDKHGNEARFDLLLRQLAPRLAAGEIEICFLGDLIHPESKAKIGDMTSSLRMLKAVIMLKKLYPDRVHLTPGNHDIIFTRPEILREIVALEFEQPNATIQQLVDRVVQNVALAESDRPMFNGKKDADGKDVLQSMIFLQGLIRELKAAGLDQAAVIDAVTDYQAFYDNCPLAFLVNGPNGATLAMHSIPKVEEMNITLEKGLETRHGLNQSDLINARSNGLMFQILWNRVTSGEYTAEDITATIDNLARELGIDPAKINVFAAHEYWPGNWWIQPFDGVNFGIMHGNVDGAYGTMMVVNGKPRVVNIPVEGTPAAAA